MSVAGRVATVSLVAHVARCKRLIESEQQKPAPDNALIAALADSIRLARENEDLSRQGLGSQEIARLRARLEKAEAYIEALRRHAAEGNPGQGSVVRDLAAARRAWEES